MIFVNFKTYKEAAGERALSLARVILEVSQESGVKIIACPQAIDLREVVKVGCSVWAQHVDAVEQGKSTGWFPPEVAKEAGVSGVLLNHSEHKLTTGILGETMARSKELGLATLVFADSPEEALVVVKFQPDYLAYEPPELIAAPTTSVARSKPEIIEKVAREITDVQFLVGAGVKDSQDVKISLERGAKGIVLSSAVILSDDPKKVLEDLASGFQK